MVEINSFVVGGFLIWIYMTGWFVISKVAKRNDVADIAWGLGFILVTLANLTIYPNSKLLVSLLLISTWGIRLAYHIYNRNKKKKEDYRYEQWKSGTYFKVFITQGVLCGLFVGQFFGRLGK
jgi:steroid 5-alpha reductase family enzyme